MLDASAVFDGVIDVSHYQRTIDWVRVAEAGIALAFIKASEGTGWTDPCFAANRAGAEQAGILVVPYHFITPGDPIAQARHFIAAAGLKPGDPAMLDWETAAPAETLVALGEAVTAVTGRDPLAYYGWAQLAAAHRVLSRWPLMLPAYPRGNTPGDYRSLVWRLPRLPPGRNPARPYDFHQYTPAGHIPGVGGSVDRSVWVGDLASLRAWHTDGSRP
jgi:lysozyme